MPVAQRGLSRMGSGAREAAPQTKVHLMVDALTNGIGFELSEGQAT